jgi:iron complex transport system substrate-binding protein
VTITKPAQRIVSLSAGNTEILYDLGLQDRIVGVDQYSDYPEPAKAKPKVGSFIQPDMEKIIVLEPDLILVTAIHLKTVLPELERRHLPALVTNPRDVKGVPASVEMVGQVTAKQPEARALAATLRGRIEAVESRVKSATPSRTFYELSPTLHTTGPGTFVDDLIKLAGGANIAASSAQEWPQLNQEALLLADPEVVLLADHEAGITPEQVVARPGWSRLSAVTGNRIFAVDANLTNRPAPRVVDGLEIIAKKLHPDRMP